MAPSTSCPPPPQLTWLAPPRFLLFLPGPFTTSRAPPPFGSLWYSPSVPASPRALRALAAARLASPPLTRLFSLAHLTTCQFSPGFRCRCYGAGPSRRRTRSWPPFPLLANTSEPTPSEAGERRACPFPVMHMRGGQIPVTAHACFPQRTPQGGVEGETNQRLRRVRTSRFLPCSVAALLRDCCACAKVPLSPRSLCYFFLCASSPSMGQEERLRTKWFCFDGEKNGFGCMVDAFCSWLEVNLIVLHGTS